MSAGRLELKVGLFVTVLLGLAAIMSVKFNETGFGLRKTYSIKLQTQNAGSIIPDSSVMMSGVKIGYVDKIDLQGDKGKVYIEVRLYPEYRDQVCYGSVFRIKSSGFLGDQYIAVQPSPTPGDPIKSGEINECEGPFDVEQIVRKVDDLVAKIGGAAESVDSLIIKLDKGVLSNDSVGDIKVTITQFREATDKANRVFGAVDKMLVTNEPAINQSITNFSSFTKRLDASAKGLEQIIVTNAPTIQTAVEKIGAFTVKLEKTTDELQSTLANNRTNITFILENMALATDSIKDITDSAQTILKEIESGNGLAGGLLKNEEMRVQFQMMLTNMNSTAVHLSNLTSNLNKRGLFYKPKPETLVIPNRSVRPK